MKANENNQKVTGVIEEFLWHCEFEKKLSEKTLNAYKADLSQFVSSIGEYFRGDKRCIKKISSSHFTLSA